MPSGEEAAADAAAILRAIPGHVEATGAMNFAFGSQLGCNADAPSSD
jgi:hypothetical protein